MAKCDNCGKPGTVHGSKNDPTGKGRRFPYCPDKSGKMFEGEGPRALKEMFKF